MHRFEISSTDPDEVVEAMSDVAISDFSIQPYRPQVFRMGINACGLRNTALYRVSSAAARFVGDKPANMYSINVPLDAPMLAGAEESAETYGADSALVLSPNGGQALDLQLPDHQSVLVLSIFGPKLDDLRIGLNGGRREGPLQLPQRLSLETAAGKAFNRFLMYLWSEIQRDSPLLASDLIVEEMEKALLTSLMLAADDAPHPDHRTLPLAYLRRAVEFILAHLSEPQSLGDIAAVAGVHGRTLQKAFRKHYGMGVMEFVQRNRLDQVNRELLALDPTQTSVTSVALAGGFLHLGRFAAAYRDQFGEFPSETLRR